MPRKPFRPPHIAPLQRVVAEEITDPAEQAAIDKMRQRLKHKQKQPPASPNGAGAFRPPHIAPLQRVVAEEITDPAEQAAIDKMRQRLKRKQKRRPTTKNRPAPKVRSKAAAKKRD